MQALFCACSMPDGNGWACGDRGWEALLRIIPALELLVMQAHQHKCQRYGAACVRLYARFVSRSVHPPRGRLRKGLEWRSQGLNKPTNRPNQLAVGFLSAVSRLLCIKRLGMSGLLGLGDTDINSIVQQHGPHLKMIGACVGVPGGCLLLYVAAAKFEFGDVFFFL